MKASELRIDSIVSHKGKPCKVINIASVEGKGVIGLDGFKEINSIQIMGFFVGGYKGIAFGTLEEFVPVPITDDILVKAGFEKHDDSNEYRTNISFVKLYGLDESGNDCFINLLKCESDSGEIYYQFFVEDEINENTLNISFKHVHRLQNFYFELSNNELEINL